MIVCWSCCCGCHENTNSPTLRPTYSGSKDWTSQQPRQHHAKLTTTERNGMAMFPLSRFQEGTLLDWSTFRRSSIFSDDWFGDAAPHNVSEFSFPEERRQTFLCRREQPWGAAMSVDRVRTDVCMFGFGRCVALGLHVRGVGMYGSIVLFRGCTVMINSRCHSQFFA